MSVLTDAIGGIDLIGGNSDRALDERQTAGACLTTVGQIMRQYFRQFPANGLGPPRNV